MTKKTEKKTEKKETLFKFFFPTLGKTIEARSLEEAKKKVNK